MIYLSECNGVIHDGGNFGETVPVEMGKSEGKGSFSMITYYAQDQMTLRDENGNVILETPCIGTSWLAGLEDECRAGGLDIGYTCVTDDGIKCFFGQGVGNRTCQLTDGWNCHLDTGECKRPFESAAVLTTDTWAGVAALVPL